MQKGSVDIDDNDSDNEESDLVKLKASRKMNTAEANPDAVIDNAVIDPALLGLPSQAPHSHGSNVSQATSAPLDHAPSPAAPQTIANAQAPPLLPHRQSPMLKCLPRPPLR